MTKPPVDVRVEIDMSECSVEGCMETEDLATVKGRVVMPLIGEVEVETPVCQTHLKSFMADMSNVSFEAGA